MQVGIGDHQIGVGIGDHQIGVGIGDSAVMHRGLQRIPS